MTSRSRILIIEDEKLIRWSIREKLKGEGYTVAEAETGRQAFAMLDKEDVDLLLLDYRLPDTDGLEILKRLHESMPEVSVVMMTAYGTVESAVQAMKLGAFDYLSKPVDLDELLVVVQKALETTGLRREVRRLRRERLETAGKVELIGKSPAWSAVLEMVQKIASSPAATTVLLEGESGTGKSLIAKAIHYRSARRQQPFVTITCSAITETLLDSELFGHERGAFTDAKVRKKGLLEVADGGTVFLDEVGEMGVKLQAKLLRFLEDRVFKRVGGTQDIHVNVCVIAATNRDLEQRVRSGHFREDLYYRLKVIPVMMPALRDREEDIPLLARYFVEHYNREFRKSTRELSGAAIDCLVRHPWRGNVRELKNIIERIMILDDKECIELEDLPEHVQQARSTIATAPPAASLHLEEMEKAAIREALEKCGHNQVRAARLLGISRDTLRYRMKKFGLHQKCG